MANRNGVAASMKLLKQRNIPWLGAVVDSLYTSLPILSIINFLSITTVLYASIREYLLGWAPWFTLWWFIGFLIVTTIVMMTCMYLFVLPSLWTFRNKQMNSFESDLLREVRSLKKQVAELKETEE
jgi:hypothetical protein